MIQQVNDYQREVFNGDVGAISSIDLEEQEVVVQFTERQVSYDYADLSELALAWAVTVHKSQGSEYPVVIFPVFMQHYVLLSRNLLYTGLTRAKQLAILVGATQSHWTGSQPHHGSATLHRPGRAAEASATHPVTECERPPSRCHTARHGSSTRGGKPM